MAVPKKKTTKSARNQRRSHHALGKITLTRCPECGNSVLPHALCKGCGTYRGRSMSEGAVAPKEEKKAENKESADAAKSTSEEKKA